MVWTPRDGAEAIAYPEFRNGTEACAGADVDPEVFYVDLRTDSPKPAKDVCRRCTLRDECLEWALATDQRYGIWGAYTPRERRKIAQDRGRQ